MNWGQQSKWFDGFHHSWWQNWHSNQGLPEEARTVQPAIFKKLNVTTLFHVECGEENGVKIVFHKLGDPFQILPEPEILKYEGF